MSSDYGLCMPADCASAPQSDHPPRIVKCLTLVRMRRRGLTHSWCKGCPAGRSDTRFNREAHDRVCIGAETTALEALHRADRVAAGGRCTRLALVGWRQGGCRSDWASGFREDRGCERSSPDAAPCGGRLADHRRSAPGAGCRGPDGALRAGADRTRRLRAASTDAPGRGRRGAGRSATATAYRGAPAGGRAVGATDAGESGQSPIDAETAAGTGCQRLHWRCGARRDSQGCRACRCAVAVIPEAARCPSNWRQRSGADSRSGCASACCCRRRACAPWLYRHSCACRGHADRKKCRGR